MQEFSRGAEAVLYEVPEGVLKVRLQKTYRHPDIDQVLRKARTRKEAKVLADLASLGLPVPSLLRVTDFEILMTRVQGRKMRDVLDARPLLAESIGSVVARMHQSNIIHGDLTTSNMILDPKDMVFLIDFGLAAHSHKIEDKAVDLHVFRQSLESKHSTVSVKAWKAFLKGYASNDRKEVLERLRIVEARGRNK